MEKFNLKQIRHYLHQHPELSDHENNTHDYILGKLQQLKPDSIYQHLGGNGLAAVFGNDKDRKTIMIRSDIDALPIQEKSNIDYKSQQAGVAHLCGHDGHSTILIGLAEYISLHREQFNNRIVLLFQPAEEIARGAKAVLADKRFIDIAPDFIFGLHNLPGFHRHNIIIKKDIFASASVGIIFKFFGSTSHAAHPENGKNPSLAISQLIQSLYAIPQQFTTFNNAALISIIKVAIGERAFGTSAGEGEVMATFRTHYDSDMTIMKKQAVKTANYLAEIYDLHLEIEEVEEFVATKNHDSAYQKLTDVLDKLDLPVQKIENPFPWSEDFGFFTEKYKGCFFGLGSGKNHPQLHNPDYNFPDALIETGITLFKEILAIME